MAWMCGNEKHVMEKANILWVRNKNQKKPVPLCRACRKEGLDARPRYARS